MEKSIFIRFTSVRAQHKIRVKCPYCFFNTNTHPTLYDRISCRNCKKEYFIDREFIEKKYNLDLSVKNKNLNSQLFKIISKENPI